MTVVGVSMVHNEIDIVAFTVRHMVAECDHVIVADNMSTDGTHEMLLDIALSEPRLHIEDEPSFPYRQNLTMNRLSELARTEYGATWVVPFDMDEYVYSPAWKIYEVLPSLATQQVKVGAYEFHPQPTDDAKERNPFKRVVWRRDLTPDHKVAFVPKSGSVLSFGNHIYGDAWEEVSRSTLYIRHVPYRSLEQAKAKSRHGKAALEAAGQGTQGWHWRHMGGWSDAEWSAWWETWLAHDGLTKDPLP
jgi:hypothetical protein